MSGHILLVNGQWYTGWDALVIVGNGIFVLIVLYLVMMAALVLIADSFNPVE